VLVSVKVLVCVNPPFISERSRSLRVDQSCGGGPGSPVAFVFPFLGLLLVVE